MKPEEIAAYIGAAAWIPQIISYVYDRFSKPTLTISSATVGELSFTSFGPVLNFPIGMAVDKKSVTVQHCKLILHHEDGDKRELTWVGLRETMSEADNGNGVFTKFYTDIAPTLLHIGREAESKFFRFQELLYKEKRNPAWFALRDHWDYLQKQNASKVMGVNRSAQMETMMSAIENSFWWKSGRYVLSVELQSPDQFNVTGDKYTFYLDTFNIDRMKKNLMLIRHEYENTLFEEMTSYKKKKINYYWSNVEIKKLVAA